jgi:predicted PurR-regulated permease PerM
LQSSDFGKLVLSHVEGSNFSLTNVVTGVFGVRLSFLTGLIIAVFGGIYLAAQVGLYRDGLVQLLPNRLRANEAETLEDISNALRLWVLGQMTGMVLMDSFPRSPPGSSACRTRLPSA